MNLLLDNPPVSVDVGGIAYPINASFRASIAFEMLMLDHGIPEDAKSTTALYLYYPRIPEDLDGAIRSILWFYRGGDQESQDKGKRGGGRQDAIYSFEHDDKLIYAAFLEQYGIDLCEADLHWWKFRALFQGLDDSTEIKKIMGYRSVEITKDMTKSQKEFYSKMKKLYRIPLAKNEQEKLNQIEAALMKGESLEGLL